MNNPYIRAAQTIPEIKEEAMVKLEARLQEQQPARERARNADGTFKADDPATQDVDEAWV